MMALYLAVESAEPMVDCLEEQTAALLGQLAAVETAVMTAKYSVAEMVARMVGE